MSESELLKALNRVMAKHPLLTVHGYGPTKYEPRESMKSQRDRLRTEDSLEMIAASMSYLGSQPRVTFRSSKVRSSYELKHAVEELGEPSYVTNGALIAAALILDIPIKVTPGHLNPLVGVAGTRTKRV